MRHSRQAILLNAILWLIGLSCAQALPLDDFRSAQTVYLNAKPGNEVLTETSEVHSESKLRSASTRRSVELRLAGRSGRATAMIPAYSPVSASVQNQDTDDRLDVNLDGLVTRLDAQLLINHLNHSDALGTISFAPKAYDTNGDGTVSALDLLLIVNCLNRSGACGPSLAHVPPLATPHTPAAILITDQDSGAELTVRYELSTSSLLLGGADSFSIPYAFASQRTPANVQVLEIDVVSDQGRSRSHCTFKLPQSERGGQGFFAAGKFAIRFDQCAGDANFAKVHHLLVKMTGDAGSTDFRLFAINTNGRSLYSPEDISPSSEPELPTYIKQEPCSDPCGCDSNMRDVGCGCGRAGPSGCDNACGSVEAFDACGVCGGDNKSCALDRDCEYFTLSKAKEMVELKTLYDDMVRWNRKSERHEQWRLFEGEGARLTCLDQLVERQIALCKRTQPAASCVSTKEDGYWMNRVAWLGDGGDDALMDMLFMDKAALDLARSASRWSTAYLKCRDDLNSAACDMFKALAQPYELRGHYISKDCQVVQQADPAKLCGDLNLNMILSPISIELSPGEDTPSRVARFRLNPHSQNSWLHWKGSSDFPLLAIDINQNGNIDDGAELFGNWTYGGKLQTSSGSYPKAGPWREGFEALATLDLNSDGTLTDEELSQLSIWSDRNSNAVTEPGELVSASSYGLSEIQLQTPTPTTKPFELHTPMSATIDHRGENKKASLVDWYSPTFLSAIEATAQPLVTAIPDVLPRLTKKDSSKSWASTESSAIAKLPQDVSGIWRWHVTGATAEDQNTGGLLWLLQTGNNIIGQSIAETPVVSRKDRSIDTYVGRTFLFGVINNASDSQSLDLMAMTPDHREHSVVTFDASRGELRGVTQWQKTDQVHDSWEYHWSAKRIDTQLPWGTENN